METSTPEESHSTSSSVIVDDLFAMLKEYGQGDYISEPISQLEHSLQAANCAKEAVSSDAMAALLHDCGQILPQHILENQILSFRDQLGGYVGLGNRRSYTVTSTDSHSTPPMDQDGLLIIGRHGHDILGGMYLESRGFPPEVYELVRDHVVAKRYLCAVDEQYYEGLSEGSKRSLEFQGGPFKGSQIEQFEKDPLFAEKVQMRKFDDGAKIIGAKVPFIDEYREIAVKVLDLARKSESEAVQVHG
ncbi:hypothetical protein EV361DRAFT_389945 [Lentinula raphanica]|nr:hypothetical protein EV361DRAFT_389945 [Lentinula raphanica]